MNDPLGEVLRGRFTAAVDAREQDSAFSGTVSGGGEAVFNDLDAAVSET